MTDPSDTGVIRLDNVETFHQLTVELCSSAVRSICILSADMDRNWLGQTEVVEQLKKAILKNRHMHIRLLVADPTLAVRVHHPLLPLMRKLSRFTAQVIDRELLEKQPLRDSFVLVDRGGVIMRQSQSDYTGFAHFDDKQTVSSLQEQFDEYWRYSHEHADLRHVYL